MGEFSPIHWLIVLAVILLLFGGRKIPELAKGLGEGIRSFKDGMAGTTHPHQSASEPDHPPCQPARRPKESLSRSCFR